MLTYHLASLVLLVCFPAAAFLSPYEIPIAGNSYWRIFSLHRIDSPYNQCNDNGWLSLVSFCHFFYLCLSFFEVCPLVFRSWLMSPLCVMGRAGGVFLARLGYARRIFLFVFLVIQYIRGSPLAWREGVPPVGFLYPCARWWSPPEWDGTEKGQEARIPLLQEALLPLLIG